MPHAVHNFCSLLSTSLILSQMFFLLLFHLQKDQVSDMTVCNMLLPICFMLYYVIKTSNQQVPQLLLYLIQQLRALTEIPKKAKCFPFGRQSNIGMQIREIFFNERININLIIFSRKLTQFFLGNSFLLRILLFSYSIHSLKFENSAAHKLEFYRNHFTPEVKPNWNSKYLLFWLDQSSKTITFSYLM